MKDFIKNVLATMVGMFGFFIVMGVIGMMSIIGMIASGNAAQNVEKNSVFVLNLSGTISEQGSENPLSMFTGDNSLNSGLNDILSSIKKAKANDDIKGIYIEAGALAANYATLQEIRNALADFRKSGKWIVAYGDFYTQGAYYVASVADKVYINPKGIVDWHGIGAQTMFYKDFMAKFGVKWEVVKVGTFKSATETFTEEKMSDANRLQTKTFIDGTWRNVCDAVSKSRGISVDSLNSYADSYLALQATETLVKAKMVDGMMYGDQVKDAVKKMMKLEKDDDIAQLTLNDMLNVKDEKVEGSEIAVYYAEGDIVQDPKAATMFGNNNYIASRKVCKDLEDLMNDDDVKAVVVRINSGGGDAYASEQMWHQMSELRKVKPVVVSMGDYAASGAYYMSAPASWIVAQPNTLTGSIGIFAVIPDLSGLVTTKLGVRFDEVKTNRNSTFGNLMARPFNAEEKAMLQASVNRGYSLFRQRVADGRRLPVESVEKIAQGRVWLATDALNIKLVDQLGGIDDAVKKAAELAKLKDYYTSDYPAAASWMDNLLNSMSSSGTYLDEQLRQTLGDFYQPFTMLRSIDKREAIQARIPYAISIK
ncbi:MAG: signal peptide peptidase SppA [Prevotella sp.]|uniref:signal peptide peptidase SppA n=1 Tax=Leyella stercorea TaxID=363265 RepID=UPI0025E600FF|nr:signal peptide peptidase SppA [Prevotella sp.]MDD7719918.1 signal peptide peptidase SppA [Leyella stercorea]MCI7476355.1 signal peptide peptidase SppA [Prevotella sp.]MCI7508331.1 signal peptide peptidase SppA [Prevotella sp.]MDY4198551.1 signal peptide peptidase SppA [Prevotella sp.]